MKLWLRLVIMMLSTNIAMMTACYAVPNATDRSVADLDQMQLKSRYGIVQLRQVGDFSDHTFDVYLDSRKLYRLDVDHAYLILNHAFGNLDAILIGQVCAGSGCGAVDLKFLVVYPDGKAKLIGDEEFRSEFGVVKEISGSADRVVLDLGSMNGKAKKATFDGKALEISYQQSTDTKSIPSEDCKEAFDVAYQACQQMDDCQAENTDHFIGELAAVEWRRFHAISNEQGFGMERFIALCNKACATKTSASYADFRRQVCKSNGTFTPKTTVARTPSPESKSTKAVGVAQTLKSEKRQAQSIPVKDEATFGPWQVMCNVDRILDRKHCYALQTKGSGLVVGTSDRWNWSINLGEGPYYPGSVQLVRIDSGEVFQGKGKFDNVKRIVDQLRSGKTVQTRWYQWPNHFAVDDVYDLQGLDDALRYFEVYFRTSK